MSRQGGAGPWRSSRRRSRFAPGRFAARQTSQQAKPAQPLAVPGRPAVSAVHPPRRSLHLCGCFLRFESTVPRVRCRFAPVTLPPARRGRQRRFVPLQYASRRSRSAERRGPLVLFGVRPEPVPRRASPLHGALTRRPAVPLRQARHSTRGGQLACAPPHCPTAARPGIAAPPTWLTRGPVVPLPWVHSWDWFAALRDRPARAVSPHWFPGRGPACAPRPPNARRSRR